jgi:glyoxylase-like metal-dependent hydrolase (beta-lactamase superfamily II)
MKVVLWPLITLAAGCLPASQAAPSTEPAASPRPELAYLEAVNRAAPPRDPQLLFLLMGQYANANRAGEGAEFFAARLREFAPRLSDPQRSLYLAAIGLLRARHAGEVSWWRRLGWVRDTIATLEDSLRLSGGQIFVVHWIAGVVYAQLPGLFRRRPAARAELGWCLDHAAGAPHPGWLREVHHQLARLAHADGNPVAAREHLRRSGYAELDRPTTLTTPYSEDRAGGHTFSARHLAEIVPGRVFALSGYEFSDYHFVVSRDGRQLLAIDAGTRPDAAESAYRSLRAHAPGLPELSTVLVTHAHWDHVGGHRALRRLAPGVKFYASSRYPQELARSLDAPRLFSRQFFGERFAAEDVRGFQAEVLVDGPRELDVGGTRIELIPVQGGETDDGLLVNLPDDGLMFVGDFMMPYLGAPFVEEGSVEGMLAAIDIVVARNPGRLLHGHEPLTRFFPTPAALARIKPHLAWLRERVVAAIRDGADRALIQQANLIPPGLLADPGPQLAYLVMRENLINRVYDQHVGYWQPDLEGLDHLGRSDHGQVLVDYLGLSEGQLARAALRMIADGKHELAASVVETTRGRFPAGGPLAAAGRLAYLELMEKYQDLSPFKFILYANRAGEQVARGADGAAR